MTHEYSNHFESTCKYCGESITIAKNIISEKWEVFEPFEDHDDFIPHYENCLQNREENKKRDKPKSKWKTL